MKTALYVRKIVDIKDRHIEKALRWHQNNFDATVSMCQS